MRVINFSGRLEDIKLLFSNFYGFNNKQLNVFHL